MIDADTKRAIKKCLTANGFDATVVDELITEGKKLRDEFAMAALVGIKTKHVSISPLHAAERAYETADACMIVRNLSTRK